MAKELQPCPWIFVKSRLEHSRSQTPTEHSGMSGQARCEQDRAKVGGDDAEVRITVGGKTWYADKAICSIAAVAARNLVLSGDERHAAAEVADIRKAHDTMKLKLETLRISVGKLGEVSPNLGQLLAQVEKTESAYGPVALEITRLGSTGKRDEAITKINKECRPLLAELIAGLHNLLTEVQRISTDNVGASKTDFEALRLSMLGLGAVAAVIASVLGVQTTRSITRPLAVAMAASHDFAMGDLARRVDVRGDDEISSMLASLETMRGNR